MLVRPPAALLIAVLVAQYLSVLIIVVVTVLLEHLVVVAVIVRQPAIIIPLAVRVSFCLGTVVYCLGACTVYQKGRRKEIHEPLSL